MAVGNGTLWHGNFKILTDEHRFNFKFHIAETDETTAMAVCVDLAARYKKLMPEGGSISYATLTRDNSKKDSRYVKDAIGPGEYVTAAGPPAVPAQYDYSKVCLLVRFEHEDGGSVSRKVNPIPDTKITDGGLIAAISAVVGLPATVPAVGAADWETEFTNFMKAFVKGTHHVVSGHAPGGPYTYFPWKNAYVLRVGDKKGGRLISQ